METYNDQLFPPAFLVNYTKEPAGRQRVLTYSLFRFLSCVSEEHPDLAQFLADQVSCPSAEDSFEILEDYLSADDYFSPSIAADGFEPFYLYAGVGYGTRTLVWETVGGKWGKNKDHSLEGVEAEIGGILSAGPMVFSLGLQTNSFKYLEGNLGIGVIF